MASHITLRQFRYFVAVAESGSVAAASRMLNIAQSAVTKSMQELEDELGQPLFERSSRGMRMGPPACWPSASPAWWRATT